MHLERRLSFQASRPRNVLPERNAWTDGRNGQFTAGKGGEPHVSIATLVKFSFVALLAICTPGPTVLLALSNGSRYGVRRAVLMLDRACGGALLLLTGPLMV
jgi:hypothetical protein